MNIFIKYVCRFMSNDDSGSNKLTGGIPSELGMVVSLANIDIGKIIQTKSVSTNCDMCDLQ